jgi:predicted AlkP superfamily pyrophosphatase or phosphodiesterase
MRPGTEIEEEIKLRSKLTGFITPDYEKYCLSNVPSTILSLFGVNLTSRHLLPRELLENQTDSVTKIVLLIIDSLGYNQFLKVLNTDKEIVFHKLISKGTFGLLTSVFPSTTGTALTSLATGLTPQEHAMIGFRMYLKKFNLVADTIRFSPSRDKRDNRLLEMGLDPRTFLGVKTIDELLSGHGVDSYVLIPRIYANSGLTRMLHSNAKTCTYIACSDMFVKLRRLLEANSDKRMFVFVYWGISDQIAHIHGPFTEEFYAEIRNISYSLKTEFIQKLDSKTKKQTLLMVTADHGQTNVSKNTATKVVNHPELMSNLVVPPTGDSRASYLYVRKEKIEEVRNYLEEKFKNKFIVLDSKEAFKKGLFGIGEPKEEFYSRIGDLMVLARKNYAFYYSYEDPEKEFEHKGSHGGLTSDDLLIPFIATRLDL